jgi:hypothetical protein
LPAFLVRRSQQALGTCPSPPLQHLRTSSNVSCRDGKVVLPNSKFGRCTERRHRRSCTCGTSHRFAYPGSLPEVYPYLRNTGWSSSSASADTLLPVQSVKFVSRLRHWVLHQPYHSLGRISILSPPKQGSVRYSSHNAYTRCIENSSNISGLPVALTRAEISRYSQGRGCISALHSRSPRSQYYTRHLQRRFHSSSTHLHQSRHSHSVTLPFVHTSTLVITQTFSFCSLQIIALFFKDTSNNLRVSKRLSPLSKKLAQH